MDDHPEAIGHFYATSNFVHHVVAMTLTTCMDITVDNGNTSWKCHDNTMT